MGSTGSGSFTDYSQYKPTGSSGNGGGSGEDICGKAFSTHLQEVSRCFYYLNYNTIPPLGTDVKVRFNGLRLSVETLSGEEIGYLPTRYNYLKNCLADNFTYSGKVTSSTETPVPSVHVDIVPV